MIPAIYGSDEYFHLQLLDYKHEMYANRIQDRKK